MNEQTEMQLRVLAFELAAKISAQTITDVIANAEQIIVYLKGETK